MNGFILLKCARMYNERGFFFKQFPMLSRVLKFVLVKGYNILYENINSENTKLFITISLLVSVINLLYVLYR